MAMAKAQQFIFLNLCSAHANSESHYVTTFLVGGFNPFIHLKNIK